MNQTPKIWPWLLGAVIIVIIVLMYYWSTQSITPNAIPGQPNQSAQVEPPTSQPTEYTPVATSTSATSASSSMKK